MTCKDCVHYERCKWNADTLRDAGLLVDFTDDDELASERCIFFKNKANFVELPCKVGDYVKWNNGIEIQLKEVFGFRYIPTDYGLRFILKDCSPIIKHDAIEGILTKEEAEQKLKGGVKE